MTNELKSALDYIIKNKEIRTVFQPIISLRDGSILGHEALSRITCESEIENTGMLFDVADKCNQLWDLDLLCRTTALEAAYKFMIPPYNKKLFVNVSPNIMSDINYRRGFTKSFIEEYEIPPDNVIFEITERHIITHLADFMATVDNYKSQNFKIAIDDAGAGYSGLNLISDLNPNYIKLDIKLIRNINADRIRYAIVKGMVEFSKLAGICLIAEGIETFEEMETLVNLGVQYGQGYIIQKPDSELREISPKLLQVLRTINLKKNQTLQRNVSNLYISNLCIPIGTVSPNEIMPNVYKIFKCNPDCFGLCVVENDKPVGIITREKLAFQLSGQYGFNLNHNKPISNIMDRDYLSVDYKTTVSLVSAMAMSRSNDKLYDFIVITEEGKYVGIVTIKDLLMKTTELEVSEAKDQNPLTGLAGNLIIEQKLNQLVSSVGQYSVAYLDIDNFKAYNDVYGFENGDLVIKLLADILKSSLLEREFIGHIGGDDFLVIVSNHVTNFYFKDLIKQFELEVLALYNQKDIENGFITTSNRRGELEKFPLITLTAVVVHNKGQNFKDVIELTETLAALKKRAKEIKHS